MENCGAGLHIEGLYWHPLGLLGPEYKFYGEAYAGPLLHIPSIGMHVSCMSEIQYT